MKINVIATKLGIESIKCSVLANSIDEGIAKVKKLHGKPGMTYRAFIDTSKTVEQVEEQVEGQVEENEEETAVDSEEETNEL